jgi:hypothetical protein
VDLQPPCRLLSNPLETSARLAPLNPWLNPWFLCFCTVPEFGEHPLISSD